MRRHHGHTSRRWLVALAAMGVLLATLASSSWPASAPSQAAATLADAGSTHADAPAALAELADGLDSEPDDRAHTAHATGDPAARPLVRLRDGDPPGVNSLALHGTSGARSPPVA